MDTTIRVAELPAARGVAWLVAAFELFRRAPLAWIGLSAGWIAITFALLILVPFGIVIANLLQPAFSASFAITAWRASAGESVRPSDLFSGFRRNMGALLKVGGVLLAAELVISVVMVLLGFPVFKSSTEGEITMTDYAGVVRDNLWIVAVGLVLNALVRGALWFAAPLISLQGMGAMQAMRWSLYAAIANLGTMAVYGATLFVCFFLGAIPWALGLIVVVPVAVISTFVSYREVFEATPR
jgi:uncharacterized membrane protein